jgi:alpha-beta hydrolase superfamily lysophospholipase
MESDCMPAGGSPEAIYIRSGERALFAFFHPALLPTPPGLGLVICKPFGYEATCAHRSVRVFAESAAAIGIPALRFDYLGTGDSADLDPQTDQIEAWSQDVVAAVAELRRRTNVDRVCLLGIRLGALVAIQAAARCPAVDSLALIAPVLSGRRYLSELRATRLASPRIAGRSEAVEVAADGGDAAIAGSLEVSGFTLFAPTLAALKEIDLTQAAARPAPYMLIIEGNERRATREWIQSLPPGVAPIQYQTLPGLIEMIMWAPMHATVPRAMVDAVTGWLRERATRQLPAAPAGGLARSVQPLPPARTTVLAAPHARSAQQYHPVELPVFLASEAALFGIVTEPARDQSRRRAVVFLNTGADHHIGPNAMHVSLARSWARRGYVVLRIDLGGIGDSATKPGHRDDDVFPGSALADVRVAIDFLRDRYQAADITLAGVCSGAYHALRAAVAGLPVDRIFLINPQNYFWKEGMTLDQLQLSDVVHETGVYRERLFSMRAWRKLLSGQMSVARIAQVYSVRCLLAAQSTLRDLLRRVNVRLPGDLGRELEEVTARGVRVVFVFARGEPGIGLLKIQGGRIVERLGDRCRIHIVDDGDHVFSRRASRTVMEEILNDELFGADAGPA